MNLVFSMPLSFCIPPALTSWLIEFSNHISAATRHKSKSTSTIDAIKHNAHVAVSPVAMLFGEAMIITR